MDEESKVVSEAMEKGLHEAIRARVLSSRNLPSQSERVFDDVRAPSMPVSRDQSQTDIPPQNSTQLKSS